MSTVAYRAQAHALRTRATLAVAFAAATEDAAMDAAQVLKGAGVARPSYASGARAALDDLFNVQAAARTAQAAATHALSIVGATAEADSLIHPGIMTMAGVGSRLQSANYALRVAMA